MASFLASRVVGKDPLRTRRRRKLDQHCNDSINVLLAPWRHTMSRRAVRAVGRIGQVATQTAARYAVLSYVATVSGKRGPPNAHTAGGHGAHGSRKMPQVPGRQHRARRVPPEPRSSFVKSYYRACETGMAYEETIIPMVVYRIRTRDGGRYFENDCSVQK